MASRKVVTVIVDPAGLGIELSSKEAKAIIEEQAKEMAERASAGAKSHLDGKEPLSGLFGYHMWCSKKKGWGATIFPKNRAAYAIGAKHGVDNL